MTIVRTVLDRRDMLRWAALASASIASAAACGPSSSGGDGGGDGASGSEAGLDASTMPDAGPDAAEAGGAGDATDAHDAGDAGASASDVRLLNALLGAELNAIAAYTAGASILAMPPSGDPLASAAPLYLQVAARFQQQHRDHAAALRALITSLGGTPLPGNEGTFSPPEGFAAGVANVLKLAANAERGAAVVYAQTQLALATRPSRFLAGSIGGDEAQHFIALYVLLRGTAQAGPNLASQVAQVVPASFVSNLDGAMNGLQSVANFTFG